MRRFLTLLGLLLLPWQALASSAGSSPHGVLLARNRTEPVVAIDPRHPSIILAGSNTDYSSPVNGAFPTAFFASRDSGRSFTQHDAPMRWPYSTGADATVAVASDGTVFYSYLGEQPSFCSGGGAAIVLIHSIDHGLSFRPPVVVDSDPADDKPTMAVESIPGRRSHLFFVWTRSYQHGSAIWFARSLDGGQTFSRASRLYSSRLDNFDAVPVVAPRSRIYVFWISFPDDSPAAPRPTRILMRSSSNDGRYFSATRPASPVFRAVPHMAQPGSLRDFPIVAATGDGRGSLYVAWAQVSQVHGGGSVDDDIVLSRSTNAGRSWSKPRPVNDVRRGDRFMPAIAAWPDGSIGLAFYDRRNGWGELDVYATRVSYAGGYHASHNARVNRPSSPISDIFYLRPGSTCFPGGRFFGDYIGSAAAPGEKLYVVWADTQLHVFDETDLWFARVAFTRR